MSDRDSSYKYCLHAAEGYVAFTPSTPFQFALAELRDAALIEKFFGHSTNDDVNHDYYLHHVCCHHNDVLLAYFIKNKNGDHDMIGRTGIIHTSFDSSL